jgi:glycerophosphoryl diester phosphodiesterase
MSETRPAAAIYGHRGARGERPENTIEGFLHARDVGVAGIETDIAMTADFVPVLHHDPALADGRLIRDLQFADLAGIPTLAEALQALPGMAWLLEIKTYPPAPGACHPPAVVVEHVWRVLRDARVDSSKISILAFDWEVLREVERQAPGLRRVCLTEPETQAAPALWWGRAGAAPAAVAATGAAAWAAFHATLTPGLVAEARALGLKILAWTVNAPADFERLAPLVDGIITDVPARWLIPPPGRTPRN